MHRIAARLALATLLPLAALPAWSQSAWQTIANPPPVLGADGQPHAASCSGYPGTDPTFRFWVRPGDPKKVAVVFDGGGACWDNLTCSNPFGGSGELSFYSPDIPAGTDPSGYGGLLDFANPANPVKDWTVVAIPYCTGDVHLGAADQRYRMVGHRGLPRNFTIHHRGYDNFMVVLDWITRNVQQDVSDLLVTGASAGGYGAAGLFPWVAQAYPQARLSVLADASQGVSTLAFDEGTPGRGSWNVQLPRLGVRRRPAGRALLRAGATRGGGLPERPFRAVHDDHRQRPDRLLRDHAPALRPWRRRELPPPEPGLEPADAGPSGDRPHPAAQHPRLCGARQQPHHHCR
jgi:hypothetical protein